MGRYLKPKDIIILDGIEYHIENVRGYGSSCSAYSAYDEDGLMHIIKEYNPVYLSIERDDENNLIIAKSMQDVFDKGMNNFVSSFDIQKELRKIPELTNSISNLQKKVIYAYNTCYQDITLEEGESFSSILANDSDKLSLKDIFEFAKSVADAIEKIHNAGYLYLDIKPENIFVKPETFQTIQFVDFDSLVLKSKLLSHQNELSCTRVWAAPEQYLSEQRDNICETTDIYAIGEMIFFAITGRHSKIDEHTPFSKFNFRTNSKYFQKGLSYGSQLDNELTELFHNTIRSSVNGRYQSAKELSEKLEKIIRLCDIDKPQLVTQDIITEQIIAREDELKQIENELEKGDVVFLSGMGGIGKTSIAKAYAKQYKYKYDVVNIVKCDDDVLLMFKDVNIVNFVQEDNETIEEFCLRKLDMFAQLCNEKTLLVLDNVNKVNSNQSEIWNRILKLNCKKIITTRQTRWKAIESNILVKKLDDECLLNIFINNYEYYDETERDDIYDIIHYFDGLTVAVVLFAKQAGASRVAPKKLFDKMKNSEISNACEEVFELDLSTDDVERTAFNHMREIFNISNLSNEEITVLASMSFVPSSGVNIKLFQKLCDLDNINAINALIKKSWIREESRDKISLHPIISEVVFYECRNLVEKYICLILGLCLCYEKSYHEITYNRKMEIYEITTFVLQRINFVENTFMEKYMLKDLFVRKCYIDIGLELSLRYLDDCIKYYNECLEKTDVVTMVNYGIPDIFMVYMGIAICYRTKGDVYKYNDMYKNAMEEYKISQLHSILVKDENDKEKLLYHLVDNQCEDNKINKYIYYPEEAPIILDTLDSIARLYRIEREYEKAEETYNELFNIINRLETISPYSKSVHLINYASFLVGLDKLDEAEKILKEAQKLLINSDNERKELSLGIAKLQGEIYMSKHDYDKAIECYKYVLEYSLSYCGENSDEVMNIYLSLASAYCCKYDVEHAEENCKNAIIIAKNSNYNQDRAMARAYYVLGLIKKLKGNFNEALEYYKRVIDIYDRLYGIGNKYSKEVKRIIELSLQENSMEKY